MSKIALETKNEEHKILKAYLEENASDILIEKINRHINRSQFMRYLLIIRT